MPVSFAGLRRQLQRGRDRAGVRNLSQLSSRTRLGDIVLPARDRAGSAQPEPTSPLGVIAVSLRAGTSPPQSAPPRLAPPRSLSPPRRARAAMRSHIGHIWPILLARCLRGDFSAWGEQLYRGEHDCAGSAQPEPPLRGEIVLSFARGPLHNDRLRSCSATISPGAAAAERL